MGSSRPTLSLNVAGTPTNNINDIERRLHLMCTLGRVRRSREDGSERFIRRKTKRLKKAIDPTMEAKKTRTLVKIDSSESDSDNINARLLGRNNNTNHAEVPDDSSYYEGDE
jgi:hypothetical protein